MLALFGVTKAISWLSFIQWSSISIHTCAATFRSTSFQTAFFRWISYQVLTLYDERWVCIVPGKHRHPVWYMLIVNIICVTVGMTLIFLQLCNVINQARQYRGPVTILCRALLSWPKKLAHSDIPVMNLTHLWIARPSQQFQNQESPKVRKSTPSVTIEYSSLRGRAIKAMRKASRRFYIGCQILNAQTTPSYHRHGVAQCAMCTTSKVHSPHPIAKQAEAQAGCTLSRCALTSEDFLAEIPPRSPRKLHIFII